MSSQTFIKRLNLKWNNAMRLKLRLPAWIWRFLNPLQTSREGFESQSPNFKGTKMCQRSLIWYLVSDWQCELSQTEPGRHLLSDAPLSRSDHRKLHFLLTLRGFFDFSRIWNTWDVQGPRVLHCSDIMWTSSSTLKLGRLWRERDDANLLGCPNPWSILFILKSS